MQHNLSTIFTNIFFIGTFKMKKIDLQEGGFNPSAIKDKVYYLDTKIGQYVSLTEEIYEKINSGQIRL